MERTPEVIDCWFDSGAMPYGQFHYPFAHDGRFEKNFPADFIAEGVDQTRGWFYSLLAISTMISGQSCYKTCMSIELILDKNGMKMSKSKGNVVDPFKILNSEGADPLRWYLFTVSPPWVPTRFDEEGVREVLRKFFGTLTNTYSFFVLYANIDHFTYSEEIVPIADRLEIDRWLLSTLHSLIKKIKTYLSRYDVTRAARAIQDFVIDDLSNWYVRRNRRRFWKAEMGKEKRAAYQTLYEVLFTVAKLVAPFSPFLSEDIYRNLNAEGKEPFDSVHLANYPDPEEDQYRFTDSALEDRMRIAREVVTLSRAARNEVGIKVRQPLERMVVVVSGEKRKETIRALAQLITEEVNVRRLEISEDVSQLIIKKAKPVYKNLGPKFGSHVNQVAEIIGNFNKEEIARLENRETIPVCIDKEKHGEVGLDDVEIVSEAIEGFVAQSDGDLTVALDTRLNEELVAEGLAREFVNRVQNMRKEAGFKVTDRIQVSYHAPSVIQKSIVMKKEYIQQEILAVSLIDSFREGEFHKDLEIEKEKVKVGIERIHG